MPENVLEFPATPQNRQVNDTLVEQGAIIGPNENLFLLVGPIPISWVFPVIVVLTTPQIYILVVILTDTPSVALSPLVPEPHAPVRWGRLPTPPTQEVCRPLKIKTSVIDVVLVVNRTTFPVPSFPHYRL